LTPLTAGVNITVLFYNNSILQITTVEDGRPQTVLLDKEAPRAKGKNRVRYEQAEAAGLILPQYLYTPAITPVSLRV